MTSRRNEILGKFLRKLAQPATTSDAALIERYIDRRDEAAFELLVQRYGPLVRRTSRRLLRDDGEADDVFQAVFMLLAQKPDGPKNRNALGPWLHGVAVHLSRKVTRSAARRREHESRAGAESMAGKQQDKTVQEMIGLLDEELAAVSEKYRAPIVLCWLEGKSQAEASRQLGIPQRTLGRLVQKGMDLLRLRLKGRGFEMTSALLLGVVAGPTDAGVPRMLLVETVRDALLFASGHVPAGAAAGAKLAANGLPVLSAWAVGGHAFKLAIGVVLAIVLTGSGVGVWQVLAHRTDSAPTLPQTDQGPGALKSVPFDGKKTAEGEAQAPVRTADVRGRVRDGDGHAVPFAAVTALVRRPFRPGEHGLRDDVVARGQADKKGNFRLRVPLDFPTWLPERQVTLLAKAPGHAPLTAIVRVAEQGAKDVDLRLTAAEGVVRGRLLAPDGAAAPGVRLLVIRLGDVARESVQGAVERDESGFDWPGPVVSDAEGRFALSGVDPQQGAWLQVDDDRYAPDAFGLRGADRPLEVRLTPAQVVEGRVVAADTGEAVAGVKLSIRLTNQFLKPGHLTMPGFLSFGARALAPGGLDGVTGPDGRFRLRSPVGAKTLLEVHPPGDSPYLAVQKEVDWSAGVVEQKLAVALPRGVVVRGRVEDDNGRPVAGAKVEFNSPAQGNLAYRPDVIQSYRMVLSAKDGCFSLTVPAGPVRLTAHGPTHEFTLRPLRLWALLREEQPESWAWREPLPGERRYYIHVEQELKLAAGESPPDVRLRLVRGKTVAGRVLGPDGAQVRTAVLLCGEKVSPLMNGTVQPLPVRDGRYELPGCAADRVYPVLFLDPVNGWGAAVDLGAGGEVGPEVKLGRCGSARLRVLDASGQPLAGRGLRLALLTERSFPKSQPPAARDADGHYSVCYDPLHYCKDPLSDGEGWLTLPALIPGARYVLQYADVEGVMRNTREFLAEPGEQLLLPDLAIRDPQPPLQGAR